MFHAHSHADPPLALAERLDLLNDSLQSLAQRLKESIAEAVGSAVAGAVRDGVRHLLGTAGTPALADDRPWRRAADEPTRFEDQPWREPDDPGWGHRDPDRPLWAEEDYVPASRHEPTSRRQSRGRWSNALGVALQAGLCWLRRQPRRRPVLTAVVVAVAAGVAALLAGPVVGAGAGVFASTAGLLLTADALGPTAAKPTG
jgi:hypothetical protein